MKRTKTALTGYSNVKHVAMAQSVRTRYCGETTGGRIKLMRDGVLMYGKGSLYEVASSRIVNGERKIRLNATPVRTTLNYETQLGDKERRIACVGHQSGKEYRFVGVVELTERRANAAQPELAIPSASSERVTALRTQTPLTPQLEQELQLIATARSKGFDPSLKLNQVCVILQESRSSIYRKIALRAFPPPIKRGKGSFWLLSCIEMYAAGNWLPDARSGQQLTTTTHSQRRRIG